MRLLLAIVVVFAACAAALPNVFQFEINEVEERLNAIESKEELIEFITEKKSSPGKVARLTDFSYKDCGGPNAMVSISSLVISPDPLQFPGPLNVAAMFMIKKALDSPLKGEVVIEKKVLGKFIKLPCIDNFGSCTYDNLCDLLEQVQCPDPIVKIGIDCRCPLKMNSYTLPKTEFDVDASVFPSGDYHLVGNATMNGAQGACLDIILTIN